MPSIDNANFALVATYEYRTADNQPAYRVLRYQAHDYAETHNKTFKQEHRATDRCAPGLDDWKARPLPYRLPNVLRAIAANAPIILVEGEKDADRLNREMAHAGLKAVATCNNGGAGHWGVEQSRYFVGANVYLIMDRDVVGLEHVHKAAYYLKEAGASSIKLVRLPSPHKDASDYLDANAAIQDLWALLETARDFKSIYQPPAPQAARQSDQGQTLRSMKLAEGDSLKAWANAAFTNIYDGLLGLSDGRFHALKAAAARLGSICAHGLLSQTECEDTLEQACRINGYLGKHQTGEARKQIEWYFKLGGAHPCPFPVIQDKPKQPATDPRKCRYHMRAISVTPDNGNPFTDGVPDEIVAGISQNMPKGDAVVYRLIAYALRTGLLNPASYTCDEVIQASEVLRTGIPAITIRRRVPNLQRQTILSIEGISNNTSYTLHIDKKTKGRPATRYKMQGDLDDHADLIIAAAKTRITKRLSKGGIPPVVSQEFLAELEDDQASAHARELATMLTWEEKRLIRQAKAELRVIQENLKNRTVHEWRSDVLWRNGTELSVCLARADGEARPDQTPPQAVLAARYGCSVNTVNKIRRLAGIDTVGRTRQVTLKKSGCLQAEKPSEPCKLIKMAEVDDYGRVKVQETNPSKFNAFLAERGEVTGVYKLPSRSITRMDWRPGENGETLTRKGGKRARKSVEQSTAVAVTMRLDEPPPVKPDPEPKEAVQPYHLGADWCRMWALRLTGLAPDDPISNADLVLLLINARRNARAYEALKTPESREAFRNRLNETEHRALFVELERLTKDRIEHQKRRGRYG